MCMDIIMVESGGGGAAGGRSVEIEVICPLNGRHRDSILHCMHGQ